ncbi:PAS domain S-box protein [Ohtaekwangia sp.]|uniref:PAS domain S-box protein n=1 Tax=Ohtaekwangia sp. TaxID=2066019 RepID=UPI002FDE024B
MVKKSGQPFKIAIVYALLGLGWIYISTVVLNSYFDKESERHINTIQAWLRLAFITVSAVVLYIFINRLYKALQQRATEYGKLFQKNPNPMWVYDLDTLSFLAVNEAAVREYGYSEKEFLSKTIKDIRPSEDIPKLQQAVRNIPQGIYSSGIWRHLRKNGELIWVEITSYAMDWEGKRAELILSHNVTERVKFEQSLHELNMTLEEKIRERTHQLDDTNHELTTMNEELVTTNEELLSTNDQLSAAQEKIQEQAEELVRQSQQKLNSILSTLKDMVWSAHFNGKGEDVTIDFVNNAAEEIYGYSPQEFYENDNLLRDTMVVGDEQTVISNMHTQLMSNHYLEIEHRILTKQRKHKWVISRIWLTKDYTGSPIRLDGIITDITQRKFAEHELITQKETLQRLIDSLPLIIILFAPDGLVKFTNGFWENTLHEATHELSEGDVLRDIFPDDAVRKDAADFMQTGKGHWQDFKTMTKEGHLIDISWCSIRLSDNSLICIGQDISQRKKQEEEKSKLLQQLVNHNNDLLQFSFIASHNLRGPVATILGLAQLINLHPTTNQELGLLLQHLFSSVSKLNDVIHDLTKILEIRSDHYQLKEWVNIQDIFQSIRDALSLQIINNNVTIRADFTPILSFFSIKSYFHSILYNLISNAIKYRAVDRPCIIEIQSFKTNTHAGFEIRDNGMGIDLEQFGHKLFTLYQRFHLDVEGKGLGLYLVRTQVHALNGTIDVASKPGEGTTFTVSFPAITNMPA